MMAAESSILYHARMRVLSRQGRRPCPTNNKRISNAAFSRKSNLHTLTSAPSACAPHALCPPQELMTRERAFRYSYLKHHHPSTMAKKIPQIPSLKRHDEARNEVICRIRAVEKAKRDKEEARKRREAGFAAEKERQEAKIREGSQNSSALPRLGNYHHDGSFFANGQAEPINACNTSRTPSVGLSPLPYRQDRQARWFEDDMQSISSISEESGEFAFLWNISPSNNTKKKKGKRKEIQKKLPTF